jgi:hypothetical protein
MDVPGTADIWTVKCPSRSSGMKLPLNSGSTEQPATVSTAAAVITVRGLSATPCSSAS